jgi:signal transduction histidine kinase
MRVYVFVLAAAWTVFVGGVLWWNWGRLKDWTREAALTEAKAAFDKDLLYRLWSTMHGGVYVPITEKTPPNEYLTHVEERDISTPSGRRLTLMNPAYMTRQIHELGREKLGLRSHITSLHPMRPENLPDEWESQALRGLTNGYQGIWSVEEIDGQEYMRYLRGLVVEEGCLKCHVAQHYAVGDLCGGISVSVPMQPLRKIERSHASSMFVGHGLLWAAGIGVMLLGGVLLERRMKERDLAVHDLVRHREHLEELVEERTVEVRQMNAKLMGEIEDRNRLEKEILHISEREQRRIGQELHDSLGQQLTGVAFMSKVVEKRLRERMPDEADSVNSITKLINEAIEQTRGLSRGLGPVDIDAGGLGRAMEELADSTEQLFGIICEFDNPDDLQIPDSGRAAHVYRIAQEAVTNAIRHGHASSVRISLTENNGTCSLIVMADGEDFPDEVNEGEGMGLRIMRYRAQMIGGRLQVGRGDKGGSTVKCIFDKGSR